LFRNHSLGANILGTKESVSGFTREDLMSYTKRFFFAENIVISFVGDIPISKLTQILEKDFSTLKHSSTQIKPSTFNSYKPFKIRNQEANFQSHVIIGGLAPGYNDEHRRGMTLLTNVLGGPALNSRLILSIREKYGYTYNIEANYAPYADIGYWSIYFGTDQKYLDKTLKQVYKEVKLMRNSALNELQLNKAKAQLKGQLALSLESNSGIMLGLGKSLLLFNQIDSIQEIYAGIDRLTVNELKEISEIYFNEKNISELIFEVGDIESTD
jgi:predicted Zn-dependent peptidase